jgi:alkanesulfonate monooxygenase SsuD/methylene tetrahydromethanopterin reductase-like flavin-dependent oxidoreductase (luciferase family)
VQDHPPRYPDWGTTLAALALQTSTTRLGPLVSCIACRSPVVLAQVAADVDRLSHGRLVLGVGIGDVADEFRQLGLPVQSVRERQAALEEALQIVAGRGAQTRSLMLASTSACTP